MWYDVFLLLLFAAEKVAEDRAPEQHDDRNGNDRRSGDGKDAAQILLARGIVIVLLFRNGLRPVRNGMHGGNILRRLVHGLAVQILDGEVKVDLRILAEFFQICEHFICRSIALFELRCHGLHADELQRLWHVGIDLARRERHGGQMLNGDGNGAVALKGQPARQHFVEHHARGVNV